jgi:hypothetical protein
MTIDHFIRRRELYPGWTIDDEEFLIKEFTVGGSCGCDGALDDGCPFCTELRFMEWVTKRAKDKDNGNV